jgi:hypothetical protein
MISTAMATVAAKTSDGPKISQPAKVGQRQHEHDGHEIAGHRVGQALHRRLRALRVLDQTHDLREGRVACRQRWPADELPVG